MGRPKKQEVEPVRVDINLPESGTIDVIGTGVYELIVEGKQYTVSVQVARNLIEKGYVTLKQ